MTPPFSVLRLRSLLLLLASLWCSQAVWACTMANTGGALGTVTSFRVQSGAAVTGSGSFSYTCGGVVLSVLAGTPSIKGTLQASVTGLTLKNGTNTIPYQIYSDPGMNTAYTNGLLVVNVNGNSLLTLLNSGGGGQVPVYISTTPGANIPAGTYTDTLQLTWTYANICEGLVNVGGLCLGTLYNGTVTQNLPITLVVTNDCVITAPTINFGSAPLVAGFPTVSQSLSLRCTKNLTYTVGLSTGGFSASGQRNMANGTNRLAYDIFKADSTVWGPLTTARADGPAAADGTTVQTIPYTARVYQSQTTPAAGSYTDNVMVDVSF